MKIIDAQNKSIGRVASQAARILMGKDKADYQPNAKSTSKVQIKNASKVKVSQKKMKQKEYTSYTQYPGGLRKISLENLIQKKGHTEVFKKAVYGMLPNNKLRKIRMKNLEIIE